MPKPLDITGERYGRLVAVASTGKRYARNIIWRFRCDCGNEIERPSGEVRKGRTRSCGCYASEVHANAARKMAAKYNKDRSTHGMSYTPTFTVWVNMVQRCTNPKHKSYGRYGGRGIEVCERWLNSFQAFLDDMGERPSGKQIDRIDNDKGYSPENCRWVSVKENARNRSNNRTITFKGETRTIREWAERIGTSHQTIGYRLKSGWSIEEALTRAVDKGNGWKRGVR